MEYVLSTVLAVYTQPVDCNLTPVVPEDLKQYTTAKCGIELHMAVSCGNRYDW